MARYSGWKNIPTIQFKEIIAELEEAKNEQRNLMLLANTGLGKTNAIRAFKEKGGKNTFVVTLGDSYNLMSFLSEMLQLLGLPGMKWKNGKHSALSKISNRLNELAATGEKPLFILDEAENCKVSALKAIKELYDAVEGNCGIVLIGTYQLMDLLNKQSNGQSVPQLRRRFKAGTRIISPFNKARDMKPFFDAFIPGEEELKDLLINLCDNYGELHDYLDPFLRQCDKRNIKPSIENFRLYHKIPKTKS